MLYMIREESAQRWANSEELGGIEWHVGAPLPEITGRVITFQADGDELECILKALRDTRETKVEEPTFHPSCGGIHDADARARPTVQVPTNRDEDGANLPESHAMLGWGQQALDNRVTALNASISSYMKILEDQTEFMQGNIDVLQRRLESVEMLFGDDVIRRANALVLEKGDTE